MVQRDGALWHLPIMLQMQSNDNLKFDKMKNTRAIYIFVLFSLVSLFSCTKEEPQVTDYINLSRLSYTFSNESDSVFVSVKAGGEWNVSTDCDWITVGEKQGDSVCVKVNPNETDEYKTGEIVFTSASAEAKFAVEQLPKSFNGQFYQFPLNARAAISPNGKYVAYIYWEIDMQANVYNYYSVKLNLETGEEETFKMEPYDEYGIYFYLKATAISDDGKTVIYSDDQNTIDGVFVNNEKVDMRVPEGYKSPMYQALSADGTVVVGTVMRTDKYGYVPVKWTNGEMETLEVPTVSATGDELVNGVIARGCSADGSVIYGSEWDHQGVIYWKNGRMFYPGLDYTSGESFRRINMFASYFAMSPNGKYLGAQYADTYRDINGSMNYPVIINTETGEAKIMEDCEFDSTILTVNNDGLAFGGTPNTGTSFSYVYDFEASATYEYKQWMKDNYGINMKDSHLINYCVDNRIFFGYEFVPTGLGNLCPPFVLVLK